jgi:hypothetical protein
MPKLTEAKAAIWSARKRRVRNRWAMKLSPEPRDWFCRFSPSSGDQQALRDHRPAQAGEIGAYGYCDHCLLDFLNTPNRAGYCPPRPQM